MAMEQQPATPPIPPTPTIGMRAPDFEAMTTFGPMKLSDYRGSWLVFFSHPGDFTPVCTTEFVAFTELADDFADINTQLLGLSIDSNTSHLAWVYSIYQTTGIHIPFPIVADRVGDVARMYGMVSPSVNTQATVRDVFIIDPEQIIRAVLIYPLTNGRNIHEILRLVKALQYSDETRLVTPANWEPGQPGMVPAPQTYQELLRRAQDPAAEGLNCNAWYWCYRG